MSNRKTSSKKDKSDRKWWILYDLIYDGGGNEEWVGYHHFKVLAIIALVWNKYIASWGGTAYLISRTEALYYLDQIRNQ